jgi:hypothetical protein
LISKILVGRKTSEVIEKADESSFGEGQSKIMSGVPFYLGGKRRHSPVTAEAKET